MRYVKLSGAYGRDYGVGQSNEDRTFKHGEVVGDLTLAEQQLLEDWNKDKDFVVLSSGGRGRYINKTQAIDIFLGEKYGDKVSVQFMYNRMKDCLTIPLVRTSEPESVNNGDDRKGRVYKLVKDVVLKATKETFASAGDMVFVSFKEGEPNSVQFTFNEKTINMSLRSAVAYVDIKMPTERQLVKWSYDSVSKSVFGKEVEGDGWDDLGSPSWLLALDIL